MSTGLFDALVLEVAKLLDPLAAAVENPEALRRVLHSLGINSEEDTFGNDSAALLAAMKVAADLKTQVEALSANEAPSFSDMASVLECSGQALSALRALRGVSSAGDAFAGLGEELAACLVGAYLRRWHPLAHTLAVLATLIEPAYEQRQQEPVVRDTRVIRGPYALDRFHFKRLIDLLRDPAAALRSEYGSLTAEGDDGSGFTQKLFPRLQRLLLILGVSSRRGFYEEEAAALGDTAALLQNVLAIYAVDSAGGEAEAGVVLNYSGKDQGDLGLVLSPFGALNTTRQFGDWTLELGLSGDIDTVAYGRHGVTLVSPTDGLEVTGRVEVTLPPPEEGRPALLLGAPQGSRLEIGGASFKLETTLSEAQQTFALAADVTSSAIVIAPGDGDGFLSSILPADGLRTNFDLGLAWSNTHGLTLRGSAGLETVIPINRSIGGLKLSTLYLSLLAEGERVTAEASAEVHLSMGPVQAAINRVGLAAALSFPERDGNLGFAQLDFGFKPPSGIGISIDAAAVVGGGYLDFDPAKGEYCGILQLEIAGRISVKALGLLSTRLPDGAPGYSFIVLIMAEDFQPIQLGMGFKLEGLGGLLAIHRTFNEVALREGLKNDTLGTLLFPRDPIANAPQILRNLATVFPAKTGSYLFGPLARIGWATPTLIRMDLALILEFGTRHRLIVLGRISSILPSREKDLVRLNMDALGILDFDQGTLSLDAVLVDSRLVQKFVLTGSMALRACLVPGPRAGFALAVGGMNPHFAPPENMPKLERIAISLTSGDNPRLTCDAYFALTANTIQFGARAALYAGAHGFSIQGDVGFDVLIQPLPFHFLAEFRASIQLKSGSRSLFKVKVAGALEGPRPLRVSANATFEICWCDFTVGFDKTLIQGEPPPAPPAVDVLGELLRALSAPESWRTEVPAQQHGVTLRKLPANAPLALDPLGELAVRQSVLPVNTARDLDVFGGAPIAGTRRFTLVGSLGGPPPAAGSPPVTRPARDLFAPAQFFELSDEDKLASPSFEEMDSGIVFTSNAVLTEESRALRANAPLVYHTFLLDENGLMSSAPDYTPNEHRVRQQALFAAVAKRSLRTMGLGRFRNEDAVPAVKVVRPGWRIASVEDLQVLSPDAPAVGTWGEARAALKLMKGQAALVGKWQLVPEYETVAE